MDKLLRFGYGRDSYVFNDEEQASIQPNFGDTLAKSVPVNGIDGGVYIYGYGRPPSGIGNVQAYFNFQAVNAVDMAGLRKEVMATLGFGPKQLIKELMDGTQVWTWGVVTNVQPPQSADKVPHKFQKVQINFHCPTARWYGHGEALFNNATLVQDGMPTLSPKVDRVSVGNGSTIQITNDGNAPAGAYIRWEAPTGVTITNPTISRDNEYGLMVDSVQYTDTLNPNDVVDIDGRNHLLQENYVVVPSYSKLTYTHGGWLVIPRGTWTLDIAGTFSGGNGLLTVDCWDSYF